LFRGRAARRRAARRGPARPRHRRPSDRVSAQARARIGRLTRRTEGRNPMKLSEVNLNDLEAFERGCPHDMFEVLRRDAPVFWQDEPHGSGYWAITKYDDVKQISRRPLEFSSERQGSLIRDPDPGALAFIQQVMLSMDPP